MKVEKYALNQFYKVLTEAKGLLAKEQGFASGKAWGGIYHDSREWGGALGALQTDMFRMFNNNSNAIYPNTVPSVYAPSVPALRTFLSSASV